MVGTRSASATISAAVHAAALLTLIVVMRLSQGAQHSASVAPLLPHYLVWVPHDATGGGRDGGGDRAIAPPRRVRETGRETTSTPAAPSASTASVIEPPDEISTLPVKPMGDATQILAGAIDSTGISAGPGDAGTGTSPGDSDGGLGKQPGDGFGAGTTPYGPGVTMPTLIERVAPKYTVQAMQARIQGVAIVECVVLADGTVGDARITRSLDRRFGLDEEALAAAKRWRFRAGTLNGKPVAVTVTIELMFHVR